MQDIIQIIDDITVNPMVSSVRKSSGFYPSSASVKFNDPVFGSKVIGSCLRKEWYSFQGYATSDGTTAEAEDKKAIGDYISQRFVEKFKVAGLYVADEVSFFHEEMNVSGRIDILIKDPYKAPKPPQRPATQDLIGVEIKSTGGYHNIKGPIQSTKDTPLAPKLEHILQVMVYLDYYSKFGIDRWILIYQDRDSMRKQWHKVSIADDGSAVIVNQEQTHVYKHINIGAIKSRYNDLAKYLAQKELPPRDYAMQYSNKYIYDLYKGDLLTKTNAAKVEKIVTKYTTNKTLDLNTIEPILDMGDFQCRYCQYKSMCWSESPTKQMAPAPVQAPDVEQNSEPDDAEGFV